MALLNPQVSTGNASNHTIDKRWGTKWCIRDDALIGGISKSAIEMMMNTDDETHQG